MKQELVNQALEVIRQRESRARTIAGRSKMIGLRDEAFAKLYRRYTSSLIECAKGNISEEEVESLKQAAIERLHKLNFASFEPNYTCTKCKDTGFIDGHYCTCLKAEISNILIKNSGFSKLNSFSDAKFEIFSNKDDIKKIYSLMQKWCLKESDKNLIYLLGNTGTGKTFLTSCMASEFISQGRIVYMTTAFNLSQDFLKFHRSFDDRTKANIFDNYLQTEILFIDDLGTEPIYNNVTREYLYLLINERRNKGLRTIITSNLKPADIREKYDERIFSRIMDKSSSIVLELDSKDVRLNM